MSRRGLLLFAAMCVIWGVPYLLIRVAVGEISPATLVFVRTAIAAVILRPFVLARGGWRSIGGRWPAVVAFATVEVAAPWFFLSSAEQHITSALAGLLISAVPLVGVVIATALGNREHLGLAACLACWWASLASPSSSASTSPRRTRPLSSRSPLSLSANPSG